VTLYREEIVLIEIIIYYLFCARCLEPELKQKFAYRF